MASFNYSSFESFKSIGSQMLTDLNTALEGKTTYEKQCELQTRVYGRFTEVWIAYGECCTSKFAQTLFKKINDKTLELTHQLKGMSDRTVVQYSEPKQTAAISSDEQKSDKLELFESKRPELPFSFAGEMPKIQFIEKGEIFHHGCVYAFTNEANREKTIQTLTAAPRQGPNEAHIGCAGFNNFDFVFHKRVKFCLLFDINSNMKIFLDEVIAFIRTSDTRDKFAVAMTAYFNKYTQKASIAADFFAPEQPKLRINNPSTLEKTFKSELENKISWLYSEESYQYVRKMALEDRISVISEDIRTTESFKKVAQFLALNSITVGSLYLSNVYDYMKSKEDKEAFIASTLELVKEDTIIIFSDKSNVKLPQNTCSAKQFAEDSKRYASSDVRFLTKYWSVVRAPSVQN